MSKNKTKTKNKKKDLGFELEAKNIIAPIIILTIFAVLIGMTIVNQVSFQSNRNDNISSEEAIWEQAFLEAEKHKVGVVFEPINTTEEEYTNLRVKCNEFIESNQQGKQVDANINVDTVVDEQQYIDGDISKSKVSQSNEDIMSETGPIYFQDMIMIRYINTEGQLKVITGMFNGDKSDILVTRQADLVKTLEEAKKNKEETNKTSNNESSTEEVNWIAEEKYLTDVSETLRLMLLANSTSEIREAESRALNYFTIEGKQTVFGNRKSIKLSSGSTIETIYVGAGKSDSSKTYKDRIYTQLRIKVGNDEFYTYIILKLNGNLRIYDIDII